MKQLTKPKTLTLDIKKWRCGDNYGGNKSLGEGDTALGNEEGYQCCLGQFSLQLGARDITDKAEPYELGKIIPILTKDDDGTIVNTTFSKKAMLINDGDKTVKMKVKMLTTLCKKEGVELLIKNEHLIP